MVVVHGGEAGHVHYHPMPLAMFLIRMVLHVPIFSTEHKLSEHASPHHQVISPASRRWPTSISLTHRPSSPRVPLYHARSFDVQRCFRSWVEYRFRRENWTAWPCRRALFWQVSLFALIKPFLILTFGFHRQRKWTPLLECKVRCCSNVSLMHNCTVKQLSFRDLGISMPEHVFFSWIISSLGRQHQPADRNVDTIYMMPSVPAVQTAVAMKVTMSVVPLSFMRITLEKYYWPSRLWPYAHCYRYFYRML
jgi:hypothetical protein